MQISGVTAFVVEPNRQRLPFGAPPAPGLSGPVPGSDEPTDEPTDPASRPAPKPDPSDPRMGVRDARTGEQILVGSGDVEADDAVRNGSIVLDFYKQVLGRDSIDGAGMLVQFTVHDGSAPGNAYWDGEGINFGPGDGKDLLPMSRSLDIVGHELTHGVNEATNQLVYVGQSGALDESFADVIGEVAQIWQENGRRVRWGSIAAAKRHDWSSGEEAMTGGRFDALTDLSNPGRTGLLTPQPGHMKDYVRTMKDNGGVHINSGIPSKAAYEAATRIGAEKMVKVWYDAYSTALSKYSKFGDAARATVESALALYGAKASDAVRDAWQSVGLLMPEATPETPAPPAPTTTPSTPGTPATPATPATAIRF